jgi:hypothetical protein
MDRVHSEQEDMSSIQSEVWNQIDFLVYELSVDKKID